MTKYFLPNQDLKTISKLDENIVLDSGISINGEKLTNGGHLSKVIVESADGKQFILKEDKATEFMLGTLYSKLLAEHSCTMKFTVDSDIYKSASEIVPNSMTLKAFIEKHPADIASIEGMEEVLAASFLMREWDFTNTNVLVQNINGRNIAVKIDHEQSGEFLFDSFLTAQQQREQQQRDELITDFIKKLNDDLRGVKIDYSKFIEALKRYTQIFPEIVFEAAQELEDLIAATKNDYIVGIKSNADYVASVIIPYIETFEEAIYSQNIQDKMWLYYILPQDSIDLIVNHFSESFTQAEKQQISDVKSGASELAYAITNQIQINGENPLIALAAFDKIEQMLVLLELPDKEFAQKSSYHLLWEELFDSKHEMFDYEPDFYSMLDINSPLVSEAGFERVIESFALFKTETLTGKVKNNESSAEYWYDSFPRQMARINDDLAAICFEFFGLQEQGYSIEEFVTKGANLHPKHETLKAAMMSKIQHHYKQRLETYKKSIAADAIMFNKFEVAETLIQSPEDLSNVIKELQLVHSPDLQKDKDAIDYITKKATAFVDEGNIFTLEDINLILQFHPGDTQMAELFLGEAVKIQNPDNSFCKLSLTMNINLAKGGHETAKAIIQLAKEKLDILPDFKNVYSYVNKYSLGENANNGIVEFLVSQYPEEYASGLDTGHNLELYLTVHAIEHDLLMLGPYLLRDDETAKLALDSLHTTLGGADISIYESLLGEESYDNLVEVMTLP